MAKAEEPGSDSDDVDPAVYSILEKIAELSNEQRQELFDTIDAVYCTASGINLERDETHRCEACDDELDDDGEEDEGEEDDGDDPDGDGESEEGDDHGDE